MITKVALIGCGIWGKKILKELVNLRCQVHVIDSNTLCEYDAKSIGAHSFSTIIDQEQKVDAYIVATPSSTHLEVLNLLTPFNIPIFVEKPLVVSQKEAMVIEKTCHNQVFMMHTWLYHPGIIRLKEIADKRELGEMKGIISRRCNWTSPRTDTDSAWNLAPHDLSIGKYILGYMPIPQNAVLEDHNGHVRGMFATLGNSPFLQFEISNRYEKKIREVRLHCSNGIAILKDSDTDHIEVYHGNDNSKSEEVRMEKVYFDRESPLRLELEDFINYIIGGEKPKCSLGEGLEIVKTIDELVTIARNS